MDNIVENNSSLNNIDLVSVIMPAFNAEKYISDAIDSVIKQTYTNWELIIIDDGSTDKTADIVKAHLTKNERIKYISQENGGQGKARNKGLSIAQGKYIAFLDADDLWFPEKLQLQVELISANKTDLVFSDAYFFEDKAMSKKKMSTTPGFYQGEESVQKFLFCNYIPILTVLAKRSAIEKVNGFSEVKEIQNAEDYHLWVRLLVTGHSFIGIADPLAHYRIHSASSTAGEGSILFPALNCLKDIATTWPRYSADISRSMYHLINDHLAKINISNWDMANRLLDIRNSLSEKKISVSFWKKVYLFLGKNIFRMLFNLKMKGKPGLTVNKNYERFLLSKAPY